MADDEKKQEPEEDEGDEGSEAAEDDEYVDTEAEFRLLYAEVEEQRQRLGVLARTPGPLQAIYAELSDSVLELLKSVVGSVGGAVEDLEGRVIELEESAAPQESSLTEEDAQEYLMVFAQVLRLIDELESAASGDSEQKEIFAALKRVVNERVQFTKEIAGLDEETEEEEPPRTEH